MKKWFSMILETDCQMVWAT